MLNLIQHIANKSVESIVPIVRGNAVHEQRKIKLPSDIHGWYLLRIGNTIEVIRPASLREIRDVKMKTFLGFSQGENIIPVNFENFNKAQLLSSEPVTYFGRIIRDWGLIRVAFTEDRKLIFVKEEENVRLKQMLRRIKTVFDAEEVLSYDRVGGGITPEMRFMFFNQSFAREQQRETERLAQLQLEKEQRESAIREMNRTVEGRIRVALSQSGAKLISITKLSQREDSDVQVVWEVDGERGRTERISSVVRGDSLAVVPSGLGFCASGGDTTQTLSSAPVLAREYMKQAGSVYITRTQGLGSFARHGHTGDDDDFYDDDDY